MSDNVGTLRKIVIDGITFDVFADTNVEFNPSKFKTEGMPTTGKTMFKMTRVVMEKKGIGIATAHAEMETLKEKAESLADVTLAVEYADGSVYRATGRIDFEGYESDSGKSTIRMIPVRD